MKLPKELREKGELGGPAGKGKKCSVNECGKPAVRSLTETKWSKYIERASLKFQENRMKKVYMCKEHYKEVNKLRKSQEKLYQKKGFLEDSRGLKKGKYLD